MREIVSMHIGQCGLQMGYDFWTGVCEEHSINPDLTSNDMEIAASNQVFFEEIDGSRFVPRSVMIDLEPGVTDSI